MPVPTQRPSQPTGTPTYDYTGQVALVTGAGSGLGLATAGAFARAGAAVALLDLDGETVRASAAELTTAGGRAVGLACDVTDEDAVTCAVDQTVTRLGRLTMAFNNAGIQAPPTDAAEEQVDVESAAVRDLTGQQLTRQYEVSGENLVLTLTDPAETWRVTYQRASD